MKKVLCACLAMLVLLCGAAMAEHFRCELPEGAWLGDTTPLREGDALLLAGARHSTVCRWRTAARRSWRICRIM